MQLVCSFIPLVFQIKEETWKANRCNQLLINFTLLFNKQSDPSRHTRRLNCDCLLTDDDHCAVANISQPAHLVTLNTVFLVTRFTGDKRDF